jgi:hypothetical protein
MKVVATGLGIASWLVGGPPEAREQQGYRVKPHGQLVLVSSKG